MEHKKLENRMFDHIKILKHLGSGSFGVTYLAIHTQQNIECAAKLQKVSPPFPQLYFQYQIYEYLSEKTQLVEFPKVYQFFSSGQYNLLVMELLGQNIEAYFKKIKQQQTLIKTLYFAQQMIERVKTHHQNKILHRDIKPQNSVFGIKQNSETIYLVDFGFSKKYMKKSIQQSTVGKHMPNRESKHFTGTQKFASINAHNGRQISRRDDLQSLFYTILFLCQHSLPQQKIIANKNKDASKKRQQIRKMKQNLIQDDFLDDYPEQFQEIYTYIRKLGFQQTPNYSYIQKKISNALKRQQQPAITIINKFQEFQIIEKFTAMNQREIEKNQNLIQKQIKNTSHNQLKKTEQKKEDICKNRKQQIVKNIKKSFCQQSGQDSSNESDEEQKLSRRIKANNRTQFYF